MVMPYISSKHITCAANWSRSQSLFWVNRACIQLDKVSIALCILDEICRRPPLLLDGVPRHRKFHRCPMWQMPHAQSVGWRHHYLADGMMDCPHSCELAFPRLLVCSRPIAAQYGLMPTVGGRTQCAVSPTT